MSWKEKLFTLINTRFYTKEEIDSKATVVFIGYDHSFILEYNGKQFTSTYMRIGSGSGPDTIYSEILVMELPFGNYSLSPNDTYRLDIIQDENGHWEISQKLIFIDAIELIGEPQVTTQQEI